MTVQELIIELSKYPRDMKITRVNSVFENAGGELTLTHEDTPLVSLEVARLLREKEFVNGSTHLYMLNEPGVCYNQGALFINGMDEDYLEAPTQSLAQKWLREKYGIHIEIYANATGWGWILTKCAGNGSVIKEIRDCKFFNTYEEALEEGLEIALKLI